MNTLSFVHWESTLPAKHSKLIAGKLALVPQNRQLHHLIKTLTSHVYPPT